MFTSSSDSDEATDRHKCHKKLCACDLGEGARELGGTASEATQNSAPTAGQAREAGLTAQAGMTAQAGLPAQAGLADSSRIASPAAWPGELQAAFAALGQQRERQHQKRPLLMATAFSGLGSQSRVWEVTGLRFHEIAAAEPKTHAQEFVKANRLLAEHHFEDIRALIAGGQALCIQHGKACDVPVDRVDFFSAGFPCQPTRAQRRSRGKVSAEQHPLFGLVRCIVEYHRARRPRLSLLEQTLGALQEGSFDGERMSECEWIRQRLSDLYHVAWAVLDLEPWVRLRRPRVWLFLVSRDVGGDTDSATLAAQLAEAVQAHRLRSPALSFRSFLYTPRHPRWRQVLLGCLRKGKLDRPCEEGRRDRPCEEGRRDRCGGEGVWQRKCEALREEWRSRGLHWADDHPLMGTERRGCCQSTRVLEVLEVTLLEACRCQGLDPRRPSDMEQAKNTTWCDYSQNEFRTHSDLPASFCTSTRPYDYSQDRIVLGEEMLLAMGWSAGPPLDTSRLRPAELHDLAGEAQALQTLAVASWALLLAAREALPGLWAEVV